jgi:hypothetical protein
LPIATTDEQRALQAAIREWAKRADTIGAVRSLEPAPADSATTGADTDADKRWTGLADLGVLGIGLPADCGGGGGSTADLGAALAQLTESLVPGPVLPTLLAARVLTAGSDPHDQAARTLLMDIAAGHATVAIALRPGDARATRSPDGSITVTGHIGPVLSGGQTTHILLAADGIAASPCWCLVSATHPGVTVTPRAPTDFSRSLADISLHEVDVPAGQVLTALPDDAVRDLAAALAAVEASAVASWCSRTAAEYAAVRQQFGRPIGSFQAIKHLCATMYCRAEIAAVLAWDAGRAIDEAPAELPIAAAAAAAYTLDAAVDNAKDCIQVLGGIGFTWDHDAHLYLRRALSLRQLLGGGASWRDRTAELALRGARRRLTVDDHREAGRELDAARAAAREVAAVVAALPAAGQRAALAQAGYAAPAWPAPFGLGAGPAAALVIDDELTRTGLARPDLIIGGWAIPAILSHGTQQQQDRFAGPTLCGEITWCQLFSEPEAGSDLASLRTRADRTDRDGGGWLLTGQKVWTSLAHEADWAICLARTDATAPKHKGLTYFLVAMDSPGIDIRPLRELTGRQMFNQVFLDQVFVPDDCVVGRPGDGWRVARTTLASERLAMGAGSSVGAAAEQVLALADRAGLADDALTRQHIGALVAEGMALSLLDLQAMLARLGGADSAPLAAVRKLAGVSHRQAAAEAALELAGPDGAASDGGAAAAVHDFLLTRCLSIAGGTTQILLSMVAERMLGLPREDTR